MGLIDRIRTLFRLLLLFTVLVAIALISAITTIRLSIQGHQEAVPNLVGMPLGTAERTARALGLELKVEDHIYSDQYAADRVVSQVPQPSDKVKPGQHVHVLVSLGPARAVVPHLVGASVRAAQIATFQHGLAVGDVAAVHIPGTAPDEIIAQDPLPSSTPVHSPALNLLVSLGDPTPAYVCPSLVGMPLDQARRALAAAGFKVGTITPVPTPSSREGTILAQSPAPGSKIVKGTAFDLQVAEQASPEGTPASDNPQG